MALSEIQIAELQKNQSHYGCGVATCKRCYPIRYRCEDCQADIPPVTNGYPYVCGECGYDNKAVI